MKLLLTPFVIDFLLVQDFQYLSFRKIAYGNLAGYIYPLKNLPKEKADGEDVFEVDDETRELLETALSSGMIIVLLAKEELLQLKQYLISRTDEERDQKRRKSILRIV